MLNTNRDNLFWQFQPRESDFFLSLVKKSNYDYTNDSDNLTTIEILDSRAVEQSESIRKEKMLATGLITARDKLSSEPTIDNFYYQIYQSIWPISPVLQLYKQLSTISNIKPRLSRRIGKESKPEIPTIHIIADPSEIALLYEIKSKKKKVDAKMLYIRYYLFIF